MEPQYDPNVRRGDVWRLNHGDGIQIFVAITSNGRVVSRGLMTRYDAIIIGSTHPSYPQGSYNIAVTNLDIHAHGEKVDLIAMRETYQQNSCDDGVGPSADCGNCEYTRRILGL